MSNYRIGVHPDDSLHVVPRGDLVEHENTPACACGPDLEVMSNGASLYVHHSLDGRERTE